MMFSLTLRYFLQQYVGGLNQCDRPRKTETKVLNIVKEEVKLSLFHIT